jgi:hypothetical protein
MAGRLHHGCPTVVIAAAVVEDEPMRHVSGVLCCAAMVLAAGVGCGGSAATSTGQSHPEVFPLTVTRTGGIAGFQDRLVVTGDGLVSFSRKGQKPRQCRLTPAVAQKLTTAASSVPWSRVTPANTSASFPDDLVSIMASPAGGPVRLEDPQAGTTGQLLLGLLNDGPAASPICRPV